jgi:hypothetical protein
MPRVAAASSRADSVPASMSMPAPTPPARTSISPP